MSPPNIVIIVWDAVRAENLPFYGYHRNTTPGLQSMAGDFAVYQNAISSSYWTLPSMTSLFTGMYPSGHGLLVDGDRIAPEIRLLTDILGQQGFQCGAFNRNPYVSDFTGLDRGFDHYVSDAGCLWDYLKKIERKLKKRFSTDPSFAPEQETTDQQKRQRSRLSFLKHLPDIFTDSGSGHLVAEIDKWLPDQGGQPFFMFFQAIETHSPYRAPLSSGLKFLSPADLVRKVLINQDLLSFALGQTKLRERDFRILRGAYDSAIHYCDSITCKIINLLKARNLYDNTLVVILADHGESIGEHNLMFHIWSLYDNLVRVPLLIKYPRDIGKSGSIDDVVQNIDLLPTILELLDRKDEKAYEQLQGNSLLDASFQRREPGIAVSELIKPFGPDKIAYRSQLSQYDRRLLSVRSKNRKFIHSSRGDHEFYELKKDPAEQENIFAQTDDFGGLDNTAAAYYSQMDSFYQANREKIESGCLTDMEDDNIKEQLEHLGYM